MFPFLARVVLGIEGASLGQLFVGDATIGLRIEWPIAIANAEKQGQLNELDMPAPVS
jgi:hypothetical protein